MVKRKGIESVVLMADIAGGEKDRWYVPLVRFFDILQGPWIDKHLGVAYFLDELM